MKQTWRWFGPGDPVSLKDIRQAGAEGIITSLHHISNGEIWPRKEIRKRINELAAEGFKWEVVESLPVHESIKTGAPDRERYIQNYIQSLKNLAAEGIDHVVYNFMALTDWTRTDLEFKDTDGAVTIRFDAVDLAVFDIYILKREGANEEYPETIRELAADRINEMTAEEREKLTRIILMGLPGTVEDLSIEEFREKLKVYHKLGKSGLRANFTWFLEKVLPVAEKNGITLSIHGDDPPFSILGLPRIVSDHEDLAYITSLSTSSSNALCLCTGTLGAGTHNSVYSIIDNFADRISFVHLRNVELQENGSFFESKLFEGSLDMVMICRSFILEQVRRGLDKPIPFRPDHGQTILNDSERNTYPGYAAIGRLKSLAELRGLFFGLNHPLK